MNKSSCKAAASTSARALSAQFQSVPDEGLAFSRAGEVACAGEHIPVWRVSRHGGDSAIDGKFVRYVDMPADIARAFREQQVLAGKPFAGAAYVEDFQLFADLRQLRC